MSSPDVSFIITCYNLQNYVEAAIRSLLSQEGDYSFEIIVIDDCSSDDSAAVIANIQDKRIHFVRHTQNQGAAASINEAFSLAKGRYIGRFDADDVWLPNFLVNTVPVLEKNPDIGLVYGDISIIDSSGAVIEPHSQVPDYNHWEKPRLIETLLSDYLICAPAVLARREAWDLGLPLPEYLLYCDFEMVLYMATQWKFWYVPKVLAQYRLHTQNMHATAIRHRRAENSIMDTIQRFRGRFSDILRLQEWQRILQKRYLYLGDQYFGAGEIVDARRCYERGRAFFKFRQGYLRRWLATYLPKRSYEQLKKVWYKFNTLNTKSIQ